MKTIYLVRHGKVDNPQGIFYTADFPLGTRGTHQAQALASDIRDAKCDPVKIIASPYVRTRETAEIIAQTLGGKEVLTNDRLIEWQVGDWFGRPLNEFRDAAGYDIQPFHLKLKDIEQFKQASERIISVINALLTEIPEDACAIIVSHREPMVAAILKLRQSADWSDIPNLDFEPGTCWKLAFENGNLIEANKVFDRSSVV